MVSKYCRFMQLGETLKVLGHPVRLCIIKRLLENQECNVAQLQRCLRQPQSTVSQHLQKLRSAGLIASERRGLEHYYRIIGDLNVQFLTNLFDFDKNMKRSISKTA
jgi:ArsR family transcriptional regulator